MILADWLPRIPLDSAVCEIGAGKSVVAEQCLLRGQTLDRLVITDQSVHMLWYSLPFREQGATLVGADARRLPFKRHAFGCIVSSLGDPYNDAAFWSEASRVLKPRDYILFTAPAHSWAECFRNEIGGANYTEAEFELSDGRHVSVPSYIYPEGVQQAMIEKSGMSVIETRHVTIGDLRGEELSPKLCVDRGLGAEVVTGYLIRNGRN